MRRQAHRWIQAISDVLSSAIFVFLHVFVRTKSKSGTLCSHEQTKIQIKVPWQTHTHADTHRPYTPAIHNNPFAEVSLSVPAPRGVYTSSRRRRLHGFVAPGRATSNPYFMYTRETFFIDLHEGSVECERTRLPPGAIYTHHRDSLVLYTV